MDISEIIAINNQYLDLVKEDILNFDKFNEYAIVHHSNSIEGSTLTLEETFLLLDEHLTPKNKPLEHTFMAIDHLEALKYVLQLAKGQSQLSADIIKHLSYLILKNTGGSISSIGGDYDSSKGEYRKGSVAAGNQLFMNYQKVPKYVSALIEQVNTSIAEISNYEEIQNLAFDTHYQMVTIHPFADGNGRLSRLLMNYVQAYFGLPLSIIFLEDKGDYIQALETTRKHEDITYFRKFMYQQTAKHLLAEISRLTKEPTSKKNKGSGLTFLF